MRTRTAALSAAGALGLYLAPAATSPAPVRRAARLDALSGVGRVDHVALTFDDGPDAASTPAFLEALERLEVRATFFVLGRMLEEFPETGRDLVRAGHEVAVHGWDHRPLPLRGARATLDDLTRAAEAVRRTCGVDPRYYRPPYGVMSWSAHAAARRLGLTPVLWTTWGRDWRRAADAASVQREVARHLRPGGTILLHDSDCTSAPGSWRATLGALPEVVRAARDQGLEVGPLGDHGLIGGCPPPRAARPRPARTRSRSVADVRARQSGNGQVDPARVGS